MPASSQRRAKLSTTVARENFQYLEGIVRAGEAKNVAQALDLILHRSRRIENRRRLELATVNYFNQLDREAQAEEEELVEALSTAAEGIDFDRE